MQVVQYLSNSLLTGVRPLTTWRASEEPMKALVVNSSSPMRSVFCRILSMRGFEVAEADHPRQAFEVLKSMGNADLVLIDWDRYELESLEFIARLRHETTHDAVAIMLIAAESGMRTLHRALLAGADDYLMEPFTSQQIDEKLSRAGLTW
jgi:PleD family two-component response regulator